MFVLAAIVVVSVLACGPDPGGGQDARPLRPSDGGSPLDGGTPVDAGPVTPPDAGPDAPPDAGPGPVDAGPAPDAGPDPDAGTPPVPPPPAPVFGWPALQQDVPSWALQVSRSDWSLLIGNAEDPTLEVPATFQADGRSWDVILSLRGRATRRMPKKSFQIRFPDTDLFDGRKRLELLAEYMDGGVLTEKTWYDLAAAAGVRVPRVRMVRLTVNGGFYGVMTEVERVDKRFLQANGYDPDADIYRCGMYDCELKDGPPQPFHEPWEKRTNEREPWDELWRFLEEVNRVPPGKFADWAASRLDLDAYLRWMAVDTAIGNRSVGDSRSFLVREKPWNRWTYVPWDLNNAVSLYSRDKGVDQTPRVERDSQIYTAWDSYTYAQAQSRGRPPTWNVLTTRIMEDYALRHRYVKTLRWLLETYFREQEIGPRADALEALLAPHLARDEWVDPAYPPNSAEYLRRWVAGRRRFLLSELSSLERFGRDAELKIDRAGRDGAGLWFVEILNNSGGSLNLSDFWITNDARSLVREPGPATTLRAGARIVLREGATGKTRLPLPPKADFPEIGLFRLDGTSPRDWQTLPRLAPGRAIGRTPSGSETFGELVVP